MTEISNLKQIKSELMDYFAATLRLPLHQIDTDAHVLELGMDSIMLVEAQRWLQNRFGCLIEVPQFFDELNTINRLASYLANAQTSSSAPRSAFASPTSLNVTASAETQSRSELSRRSPGNPTDEYELMRSQLALMRDVIEAQNSLLATFRCAKANPDDR